MRESEEEYQWALGRAQAEYDRKHGKLKYPIYENGGKRGATPYEEGYRSGYDRRYDDD